MSINLDAWLDHEWAKACEAEDAEQGMINFWGERCSIYQEGCCACDAWKRFDETGEIVKP
jgi:hypothetical protein